MYRIIRLAKNNNHLRATKLLLSAFYRAHNLVKNPFFIMVISLLITCLLQVTLLALNEPSVKKGLNEWFSGVKAGYFYDNCLPCNNNRWFEDRNPARAESAVTVINKGNE